MPRKRTTVGVAEQLLAALLLALAGRASQFHATRVDTGGSALQDLLAVWEMAYTLYVGGEVIHAFAMDEETGALEAIASPNADAGGGFMAFSADWSHLYTTDNPAGAAAFRVLDTGALEHIHTVPTLLQGNAHITVVANGDSSAVVLSSYGSGGVNVLKVSPDSCGLEEPAEGTQQQHVGGSGAHPTRQGAAHPHSNFVDPSGTRVLVSDLGQDKIYIYAVDPAAGTLTEESAVETAPAAGPRHCVFSPSGEWVYGINELDCTINAYSYAAGTGEMSSAAVTVSTLPEGYENEGPPAAKDAEGGPASAKNTTADIHITSDGRFLYGSNRGHDSIVCFEVDPGDPSKLSLVGWTPTYGAHPRNFGIHPSGQWLIVANQNSDNIVLFRLDPSSGVLTREGDPISVEGKPRCIKFRPC